MLDPNGDPTSDGICECEEGAPADNAPAVVAAEPQVEPVPQPEPAPGEGGPCDESLWPDLDDHDISGVCGECKVLVHFGEGDDLKYLGTCSNYCAAVGDLMGMPMRCAGAYEDNAGMDNCEEHHVEDCDEPMLDPNGDPTSDGICECIQLAGLISPPRGADAGVTTNWRGRAPSGGQPGQQEPSGNSDAERLGMVLILVIVALYLRYKCSTKLPAPSTKDSGFDPVLKASSHGSHGSHGSQRHHNDLLPTSLQGNLGGVPSPPDTKAAQAAAERAAAAVAMASTGDLELGELPLPSWSVMEVCDWLKEEVGVGEQVVQAFENANVDGFMLSRMRDAQDLEDILPPSSGCDKSGKQAIVKAAQELMAASASAIGGARTAYGKELGHDRFD